jgi:hypothetical protein
MRMFRFVSRWIAIALMGAGLVQVAHAAEPSKLAVSDVLFAHASTWIDIGKTPFISPSALQEIRQSLTNAYRELEPSDRWMEGPGCSFIERALEPSAELAFHRIDIDRDGIEDVVYVGSAHCAEGAVTVIWYGTGAGYKLRDFRLVPLRALRVSPDRQHLTSVSEGCCGAPTDEYLNGSLKSPRAGGSTVIVSRTTLPPTLLRDALSLTTRVETRLRLDPRRQDGYDQDRSQFLNRAAFGNIVRRYMPQSHGRAIAETHSGGLRWLFVIMDSESDPRVIHDPYGANVGWVLASDVVLSK